MEEQLRGAGAEGRQSMADRALGDRTAATIGNHLAAVPERSGSGSWPAPSSTRWTASGSRCFLVALRTCASDPAHLGRSIRLSTGHRRRPPPAIEYHDSADTQHNYWQRTSRRRFAMAAVPTVSATWRFRAIRARAIVDYEAEYDRFVKSRYPVPRSAVRRFVSLGARRPGDVRMHADTCASSRELLLTIAARPLLHSFAME